jgi:hypothetical protein
LFVPDVLIMEASGRFYAISLTYADPGGFAGAGELASVDSMAGNLHSARPTCTK